MQNGQKYSEPKILRVDYIQDAHEHLNWSDPISARARIQFWLYQNPQRHHTRLHGPRTQPQVKG